MGERGGGGKRVSAGIREQRGEAAGGGSSCHREALRALLLLLLVPPSMAQGAGDSREGSSPHTTLSGVGKALGVAPGGAAGGGSVAGAVSPAERAGTTWRPGGDWALLSSPSERGFPTRSLSESGHRTLGIRPFPP